MDVVKRRRGWSFVLTLALGVGGCGGDEATGPAVASVSLDPTVALAVGVGDTVRFTATVLDRRGFLVTGATVTWSSDNPAVATVDARGRAVAVGAGLTAVRATCGGLLAVASLEVWVPPVISAYQPGTRYFGRKSYVEYVPGELPLVVSAPHGGNLEPLEIPDRTGGTQVTDQNVRETVMAVRQALIERTGRAPHVILMHLKRTKVDANREIVEAAEGNPFAENAWAEFQGFIDTASAAVVRSYGSGFYIDIHGHGHAIARAELGYLLSSSQLNRTDAEIDAQGVRAQSSVRALAESSSLPFSALLRGSTSLGALLQKDGIRSVPSPGDPSPGTDDYFGGGYNTDRHGSRAPGRTVSGVQIELPYPGIRDTDENRSVFGQALAKAMEAYMTGHFGFFRAPR